MFNASSIQQLSYLLKQWPVGDTQNKLSRKVFYQITIQGRTVKVKISHSILRRKTNKKSGVYRYQVLGRGKDSGGTFGKGKKSIFTLKFNEKDLLILSAKNRYIKIMREESPNELKISKKIHKHYYDTVKNFSQQHKCNKYYMVMPYFGKSLSNYINDNQNQDISSCEKRLNIGLKVLDQVERMHQEGYIHADLKPENFTYEDKGKNDTQITVIDFGKSAKIDGKLNIGTLKTCAPEAIKYSGFLKKHRTKAKPSADIFSLGFVLFELCSHKNEKYNLETYRRIELCVITYNQGNTPRPLKFLYNNKNLKNTKETQDCLLFKCKEAKNMFMELIAAMTNIDPARRPKLDECKKRYKATLMKERKYLLKKLLNKHYNTRIQNIITYIKTQTWKFGFFSRSLSSINVDANKVSVPTGISKIYNLLDEALKTESVEDKKKALILSNEIATGKTSKFFNYRTKNTILQYQEITKLIQNSQPL